MANIFTLENFSEFSEKINIDDLYEKKRQYDLNKLELFRKILNRVHIRIKTTARQNINEKFDQAGCIAYLMDTLQTNGFQVRYFHPNTILISWNHWVPSYVRNEIKKKTGIVLNEYGEKIENEIVNEDEEDLEEQTNNTGLQQIKNSKKYTPINSYRPSGKLVYSEDLLNKIENRISDN